ncbi:hypothetical protein F4811DRAFT_242103 [Daldinia bambusicola]|nr:hypothetical protein F4811DRAFT_242103 [Daldinia bambusicola]
MMTWEKGRLCRLGVERESVRLTGILTGMPLGRCGKCGDIAESVEWSPMPCSPEMKRGEWYYGPGWYTLQVEAGCWGSRFFLDCHTATLQAWTCPLGLSWRVWGTTVVVG